MFKLAFLLIGPASFRSHWYVVPVAGALLVAVSLASALGMLTVLDSILTSLLGLGFALYGLTSLLSKVAAHGLRGQTHFLLVPVACFLFGLAIGVASPFYSERTLSWLFAILFVLDGVNRIVPAVVSRFPAWRHLVFFAVAEFCLAAMLLCDWPLPQGRNVDFCIALFIGLSGWLLIRLGILLHALEDEAAMLLLPIFGKRGWYEHAPVLILDEDDVETRDTPIRIYVWTPVGSANIQSHVPILDRYLAAIDPDGKISTGHSALEMGSDLYISHNPSEEIARSSNNFLAALSAGPENHIAGFFQPSYDEEVRQWCPANFRIEIKNISVRRLRAFWVGYKQDSTYNVANRNCSTVVAAALDACVEGALATHRPWRRLLRLMINPNLWVAALVRSRADAATWTPGLVLDYAKPLAKLVDGASAAQVVTLSGPVSQAVTVADARAS